MQKIFTFLKRHKLALGAGTVVLLLIKFVVIPKVQTIIEGPAGKYETVKLKREDIESFISASGRVEAENQAILQFQTSGQLAWVGVKKGDQVKKWQAVASLDKRELENKLKKELNDYLNERWDFEQTQADYKETKERRLVTDAIKRILEKAQFDLNNSVIDYEIANLAVKLATIVSPIEGIVTEIEAPLAGINITPATAQFTVVDPSIMKFVANIDEEDVGQVRPGQKVTISLDAYPNEEFEGTVDRVAFAAITTRGGGTAYPIDIYLPENNDQKFKSGMNGDAEILLSQEKNVLAIPIEALAQKNGKSYVKIIENRQIREIEVETGIESENKIQILSGLTEEQQIIIGNKKK